MQWFLRTNHIIIYFHILIVLSLLIILDYLLFSKITALYNLYLILLLFGLFSAIGITLSMNTVFKLLGTMKHDAVLGNQQYDIFIQFIITLIAAVFIAMPGFITSSIGWFIYIKPIRMIITKLLYNRKRNIFQNLYAYFLAEHIKNL